MAITASLMRPPRTMPSSCSTSTIRTGTSGQRKRPMAATHRRLFLVRTDSDSAKGENMSDDLAYFYTKTQMWNTADALPTDLDGDGPRPASTLLGHNGQHKIALVEVNGQPTNAMRFQKKPQGQEWQNDSSNVQTTEQTVGNLLITEVSTSNGTADYFKFNPTAEDGSNLLNPEVNFTIKDEGDSAGHFYRWRVRVRSTDGRRSNYKCCFTKI